MTLSGGPDNVSWQDCCGPKALPFSQPRASPGGKGIAKRMASAQRANRSPRVWRCTGPLGRRRNHRVYDSPGRCPGLEELGPFGANGPLRNANTPNGLMSPRKLALTLSGSMLDGQDSGLIIYPTTPAAEKPKGHSISDVFGKAPWLRTAEDIDAQLAEERDWGNE
jgi:hypothetical protein